MSDHPKAGTGQSITLVIFRSMFLRLNDADSGMPEVVTSSLIRPCDACPGLEGCRPQKKHGLAST